VSDLGDAVGRVALTMLVHAATGSALLTGSVVVMYTLPFLGPGQWITARVAHLPRRQVLVVADLVRAVCFGLMVLPLGVLPRLALVLVASFATPPFTAVAGAVVARSVPDRLLGRAAGLRTGTTELSFVVGFAVGGLVADLTSPVAVIGFDALTFLASAAILGRAPIDAPPASDGSERRRAGDGVRAIAGDPHARRIVLLVSVAFALILVPETLVASYAGETFPDIDGATGALAALAAVGVIAATLVSRPDDDDGLVRHAAVVVLVGGLAATVGFLGPDELLVAAGAYLAVGPVLAIRVHAYTVLSRRIDDVVLPPAISVAAGVLAVSYLLAGLGGGAIADLVGVDRACALATAFAAAVGVASLLTPIRQGSRTSG
jgi:predicted MFS family arabinose efflux permease